ncbi:VP6 [Rotavirus I]|uniref:VP6 n=1 Tax=Rotavirus I TaxID=1637496 RepID=A0A0E3M2M8_9REOV|nr:VP6 [Rotavirus I]AKA63277.1 VP6 [Rotavirus I]
MDLVECINGIITLKERVRKLAPNAPLTQEGLATLNDYNAVASSSNGTTVIVRDVLGQLSPFTINAPLTPITNVLSTDVFDDIKSGLESMLEALAGAARSEGSRRTKAIITKAQDPEVKKLIGILSIKSQLSNNVYANTMEFDTARAENPIVEIDNPFFNENIQHSNVQGVPNAHGGGYISVVGRASGNQMTATCIAGRDDAVEWDIGLRVPTSGSMAINFLPTPGRILLPRGNRGPNDIPTIADCVDVSADADGDDITVQFMLNNQIVFTREAPGQFSFPMCDSIHFIIRPWTVNKNNNPNALFVNWDQGGAQAQPTLSLLVSITNASAVLDAMVSNTDAAKPNYLMNTIFTQDSFVNTPNINWTFLSLLNDQDPQTAPWSRKIASLIAAFAAQN